MPLTDPVDERELYANLTDPEQTNEKSDLPPQVAADLGPRDLSFMEDRFGSRPSEEVSDEESIERLRALGYLE